MTQSPSLETNSFPVKKSPTFYEARKIITAFRTAGHLSLFWARIIPSYLFKTHFNITLLSYTSGLSPDVFPPKTALPRWCHVASDISLARRRGRGVFSVSLGSSRYNEGITASCTFIVSVQVCPQVLGQKETELLRAKCFSEVGCGYMDWIGLAQDRDRWRTLVSAVMNLRVPWHTGNFLTSCKPVSVSRTLHHGVSK